MTSDANATDLAELAGASKRFDGTVALDAVDLEVRPGELLAVLGPNGAGKTTAISLLLGLERPDEGSARLFGRSPLSVGVRRWVGVMMQEIHLAPELRVHEQIDLVASYYPAPMSPDLAMETTRTTVLGPRPYGKLSGGQKRQAQFAMAICGRPQLLFLDEPTVGLDVRARELMWDTVRHLVAAGTSVVLTTHYLEEAEALADRVAVLAGGRVIATGTVGEIRGLVARKQIRCATTLGVEELRSWPGVESVTKDGRMCVTTTDAEGVLRRLLAADVDLRELEVQRAGLAEAFAELTQESES